MTWGNCLFYQGLLVCGIRQKITLENKLCTLQLRLSHQAFLCILQAFQLAKENITPWFDLQNSMMLCQAVGWFKR